MITSINGFSINTIPINNGILNPVVNLRDQIISRLIGARGEGITADVSNLVPRRQPTQQPKYQHRYDHDIDDIETIDQYTETVGKIRVIMNEVEQYLDVIVTDQPNNEQIDIKTINTNVNLPIININFKRAI